MNLNSYQVYTSGFVTPIILFGIYYITKIFLTKKKSKNMQK